MNNCNSLCVLGTSVSLKESRRKAAVPRQRNNNHRSIEKVYSISGQAPSPSKDFFELIVSKDIVIWRAWRIKCRNYQKFTPTEERLTHDEFANDGKIHREVLKSLGEDVLNTALCYTSEGWLARLPQTVLANIFQYLQVKDLCMLSKVCSTLRIRSQDNNTWKDAFHKTFGLCNDLREKRAIRFGWKIAFKEEWNRQKNKEIDWDNL